MAVVDSYEVIVAGGGVAGTAAAVSAARMGAKTLLIERYGFLGGLGTAGLVTRSKTGRTVTVRLAPEPMKEAMDWLRRYERFWSARLDRLAAYAEAEEAKVKTFEDTR